MAKKVKKSTIKRAAKAKVTRVAKPKAMMSSNMLVALMIGLVVVVGVYAYTVKNKAVPADVMVVAQPNSFSFSDRFGDGLIAKALWNVSKSDGVTVVETKSDNLRVTIPVGAVSGKPRNAIMSYKEMVSAGQDFTMSTRLYKPIVSGSGIGRSGIRFGGGDGNESEGLLLYWEVSGTTSEIVFVVNAGGTNVSTQRIAASGSQIQLMLKRTGTEYSAAYRSDNFDDDNPLVAVGESVVSPGQVGGKVRLFVTNVGEGSNYPRVVGRFDSVTITSNLSSQVIADNFDENGALEAAKWGVQERGSVDLRKANGNLIMHIDAAQLSGENTTLNPSSLRAVSTAEITKDKRGVAIVEVFKPNVPGPGTGMVGLSFNSESDKNEESASIRWVVTGNTSKLVFAVRNAAGKVVERESVTLGANRNRVTLRLTHGDGKYNAQYRLGPGLDDDTGFKTLGTEVNPRLGAKGAFGIFAVNTVVGNLKSTEVTGKFDSFRVIYK